MDEGRFSIAQDILLQRTDFLRKTVAPNGGAGSVTLSYVLPSLFPLKDYIWWSPLGMERSSVAGGVGIVGASDWKSPKRILVKIRQHESPRSTSFSGSCGTTRELATISSTR